MWLQWLEQPWFRGVTCPRLTHLQFPSQRWGSVAEAERAETLAAWLERSRQPGFRAEIDALLADAVHRSAEKYRLQAWASAEELSAVYATRTWRLRERFRRGRR
jgi:hypothetical protein